MNHNRVLFVALAAALLIFTVPSQALAERLNTANLDYDITGSSVITADASTTAKSLMLGLDGQAGGVLSITLPREFIDARIGGVDDEFFVLVNGQETTFGETKSADSRTLRITFEQGTGDIEIIGTQINPSALTKSPQQVDGGGCLIATAAHGTEMSPQVQLLREVRDSKVSSTQSGAAFMTMFNQFYYSFSPTISDMERQNPLLKEAVKVTITPMLSTLTILHHVDVNSEQEMLGYGIGIILLNMGIYFVVPAAIILQIRSRLWKKPSN